MIPARWRRVLNRAVISARLVQKRPRGYGNYLLSLLSEELHMNRSLGNPVSITLEPINTCNLECPVCETGSRVLARKPQIMSYDDFVKIMDKVGPGANHVMLYYMGEPFLNKSVYKMIRYARNMGLYVTTCTNGDYVDPEALYNSGINHISFQIGGITQEIHQVYRKNSDLSAVLKNLRSYLKVVNDRGKRENEHEVELGLIVMRQNENDIEAFLHLCEKLKVKATLISPCVRTPGQAREFLPDSQAYWIYDRKVFENDGRLAIRRVFPWNSCPWLYYAITIQVDGNVVPCCRDPQGKYLMGNLLNEPLDHVWNGPEFRKLRHSIRRGRGQHTLCTLCPGEGEPELR